MNAEIEIFANRLLAAHCNGAWQGLLLTALILLLLRLVPRANAATRHAVALMTLLVVAALPVLHFLKQPAVRKASVQQALPAAWDYAPEAGVIPDYGNQAQPVSEGNLPGASVRTSARRLTLHAEVVPEHRPELKRTRNHSQSAITGLLVHANSIEKPPDPEATDNAELQKFSTTLSHITSATANINNDPPISPQTPSLFYAFVPRNWQLSLPKMTRVILLSVWMLLALVRLGSLARQYALLHALKRRGEPVPENMQPLFESLKTELGIRRTARLQQCPVINAPMVFGFRQPSILLPARMLANTTPVQLEQVLRHELAHVRRYDDWGNFAQQVIAAILFFNPAVCWLSRRLTIEREIACDDHVLAATPNPRAYALFLTEFAGRIQGRHWLAAPAAWNNKHQLKERIVMILNSKRNISPRPARVSVGALAVLAGLFAVVGWQAGPRLALAQEPPQPTPAKEDADDTPPNTSAVSIVVDEQNQPIVTTSVNVVPKAASEAKETDTSISAVPSVNITAFPRKVTPGAKQKPNPTPSASALPPQPGLALIAPMPPMAAMARTPAMPSAPMVLATPVAVPTPPQPMVIACSEKPVSVSSSDASLEDRVKRLEHLVQSLLAKDQKKSSKDVVFNYQYDLKGPAADVYLKDKKTDLDKLARAQNDAELARFKDQAKKAAEHAAQEANRAAQEMDRATREAKRLAERNDQQMNTVPVETRSLDQLRKQLEAQQRALEKQIQAIEKQLERLEAEQEKINEMSDRKEREQALQNAEESRLQILGDLPQQNNSSNVDKKTKKP